MIAASAMLAVFVGLLGWCALRAAFDARRDWRLEHRIAEIGHDQVRGVVERITSVQFEERGR